MIPACQHCGAELKDEECIDACYVCNEPTCQSCCGDGLEVHATCEPAED